MYKNISLKYTLCVQEHIHVILNIILMSKDIEYFFGQMPICKYFLAILAILVKHYVILYIS